MIEQDEDVRVQLFLNVYNWILSQVVFIIFCI